MVMDALAMAAAAPDMDVDLSDAEPGTRDAKPENRSAAEERRRGRGRPPKPKAEPGPKKDRPRQCAAKLILVEPTDTCTDDLMTVFVTRSTPQKPSGYSRLQVRLPTKRKGHPCAVPLWPLYRLPNNDERFVVIAPSEEWFHHAILLARPTQDQNNHGDKEKQKVRALTQALHRDMKNMLEAALKTALDETRKENGDDDLDHSKLSRPRVKSGVRLQQRQTVRVKVKNHTFTIVNYGKLMIAKLDMDTARFVENVVVGAIEKRCATSDVADDDGEGESSPDSHRSAHFEDATPNLHGRVVWDTDRDSWKITYKASPKDKLIVFQDSEGSSLHVDYEKLGRDAAELDKQSKYKKACKSWNLLDNSQRPRITIHDESTSSDSLGDSLSIVDTQSSNA